MKKLFICATIGLFSSSIFAAEPPIDCEELAQHIKDKLKDFEYGSNDRFYGVCNFQETRRSMPYLGVCFIEQGSCEETYWKIGCRQAGAQRMALAIKHLPYRIEWFQRYHKALAKCTESSATSCPLALQTMKELQEKMNACTQCITEYNEGKAESIRKSNEASKKEAALAKFIHDANQEK